MAVATDPRAGVAADAADCSTVGSPPVEPRYSCPAAGSAWAAVADAVAAGSVDPAVFGDAVADDGRVVAAAVAVADDGRVAAAAVAVAVLDVVVPRKLLPNLSTVLRRQVLMGFERRRLYRRRLFGRGSLF